MIIITQHAEERLLQRTLTKRENLMELVRRAWKSPAPKGKILEHCRMKENFSSDKVFIYRKLGGFVYVFAEQAPNILLVTAYYYTYTPKPKRRFLSLQTYGMPLDERTKRKIKRETKRSGSSGQGKTFRRNAKHAL